MISIDTKLLGLCDDCPEFEPKMEAVKSYADNKLYRTEICVTCENYTKCRRIYDAIKGRLNK